MTADPLKFGLVAQAARPLDTTTGELAGALRAAFGDRRGAEVWPALLSPERAGTSLRLPPDAVQLHHSLVWRAPVPRRCLLRALPGGQFRGERGLDLAFTVLATDDGTELARANHVVRCPDASANVDATQQPVLPAPPGVPDVGRVHTVYQVARAQVLEYADVLDAHPAIHVDSGVARALGFQDVLVQGLRLVSEQLSATDAGGRGAASVWFRRPVTADAEVELHDHGNGLWTHRLMASGATAVLALLPVG